MLKKIDYKDNFYKIKEIIFSYSFIFYNIIYFIVLQYFYITKIQLV